MLHKLRHLVINNPSHFNKNEKCHNPSNTRGGKAQQTPRRQSRHEHQAHKSARRLLLAVVDPLDRAHHARAADPAVGQAESELDDDEVEEIAGHDGAAATDVAEEVEG